MDADRTGDTDDGRGRLAPDARVGDYRVKALIGAGAMGEVYLAQDLVLGRRVALKLVRTGALTGPAIDRFLEEARATAAFNHPHIVTLYAVGDHAGQPYLALEFLDGESLRARCAAGPLPERDALRTVRAIAEAVAEAHARGIIHADLKPENVMVPRDGRLRVVDFGLARLAGAPGTSASGTPSYMAPERWTGAAPSGAIDVWSLGVMLFELCTGARPWTDAELARLAFGKDEPVVPAGDEPWRALVRACVTRSPTARPSAAQVVAELTTLLEPPQPHAGDEACPFPGLVAFGRDDRAHYVGRAAELDLVIEALRAAPLLPIAGPSGVGKSSFVSAAVAPRLEESGGWSTVVCRPGATPFATLAAALGHDDAAGLRAEPTRLTLALTACAAQAGRRVLLVVDQFEECFTLAGDEGVALCGALAEAARPDEPWRIVVTVRDDFLARLAAAPAMRPHLGALVMLAPMTVADLRAAVRAPLANVGYATDSAALPGRIATDVVAQPASLALLQFACRALWDRRDVEARCVTTSAYDAIGGAAGALATHAERVLAELPSEQVRQVRAVFLELVAADGTRRPRPRRALDDGHLGDVTAVVDLLVARRLLVTSRQLDDADAQIEIAHEALATAWPRLGRWLDETHEERLLVAEVEQAATLWSRRGQHADETWTGPALAEAVRKVEAWNVQLPSESRRFLDAGQALARRRRRLRRWSAGLGAGGLVAVTAIAVLVAIRVARSEREAQAQKREVLAQQARIKLAAADMGRFELVLTPYDWDPRAQLASPPKLRPVLTWRLRAPSIDDIDEPGRVYAEGEDVRRGAPAWDGDRLTETVEARSGRVFLETDRGPGCAPSVLLIQRLPGYAERDHPARLEIDVPTCQATLANMVEIPAGPFWRNVDTGDGIHTRDEVVDASRFRIQRTEVTRGAFAMYAALHSLTSDDAAPTASLDVDVPPRADLPVVGINHQTARHYCRYIGGRLPTVDQAQKALRGGLTIDGTPNPQPQRSVPWGDARAPRAANLSYAEAPPSQLAPVASFVGDQGPYRMFDLAGNVTEWTADLSTDATHRGLYRLVGGNWGSPPELGHHTVQFRNLRPAGYLDFAIGVRCVTD